MSDIINCYLADYPTPWIAEREISGFYRILDKDGGTVDCSLVQSFAEFAVAFVNQRHANRAASEMLAIEIEAKLAELRDERDAAHRQLSDMIDAHSALLLQSESWRNACDNADEMRNEMAELHDIIAAQRDLIDGLQRRLSRKEAR